MAMHSNWNPWHGCVKCSEGCRNCYMYYLDALRGKSGAEIYKTKTGFRYPLSKDRTGRYKVQSGEMLSVCMTSDFFLAQADGWRKDAWDIMRKRRDVVFYLLTKRPQRVRDCLPDDWGKGWEHVFFNVTCENQEKADERIPILLELPFQHKGLSLTPLLGPIRLDRYLDSGQIELVVCGGENYGGARLCDFDWVKALRGACVSRDITFCFLETGTNFRKDGKHYTIRSKRTQTEQALRSGMNYQGKRMPFDLVDSMGNSIPAENRYVKHFGEKCEACSMRLVCNGCHNCGKCD